MSKSMPTPILVAVGQTVDRDNTGSGARPVELITKACQAAEQDAQCKNLLASVNDIVLTGLTVDAPQAAALVPISGSFKNLPKSVANALDINPQRYYSCATGGDTPQLLINLFARRIASSETETVLLAGGETLSTMLKHFNRWYKWLLPKPGWGDNPGGTPETLGTDRDSGTAHENLHGLDMPYHVYALFENALQHHYGRTFEQHQHAVGHLFAKFAAVAAANPYAWFQKAHSAETLVTTNADNRYIAFPYTKLLNSMIMVNQAAAVVLTNTDKARTLGIPEDRWIYLHGFAEVKDIWNVTERENFYSSPAMRKCAELSLAMAGKTIDEIKHFDLYSCFPSAVQIACDEFGISHDDPRGLTLTGGLPYFGGPGNNYAMHSIAEMTQRLRANPGDFGLLNANGWFLTKHSLGIYSSEEANPENYRYNNAEESVDISSELSPETIESPSGEATIETFTVLFNRKNKPEKAIIIGRDNDNRRFIANDENDSDLEVLCGGSAIGMRGTVTHKNSKNNFRLL